MYPDPSGSKIADLVVGDEVVIAPGYGYPQAETERKAIIASVEGFSALTADGIMLMCSDGAGVTPTGNYFDSFELSDAAKKILDEQGISY